MADAGAQRTTKENMDRNNRRQAGTESSGLKRVPRRLAAVMMLAGLAVCFCPQAHATDYFISSSQGSDSNSGLTESASWETFANVNSLVLTPGDSVLLRRGDVWNQELRLQGDGTAGNLIELGAYGTGDSPVIQRTDLQNDLCVVLENPSGWRVSDLHCRNAKLGLYLRYVEDVGNEDVEIGNCQFEDMSDPVTDPHQHDTEFAWSAGIWIGGRVSGANESQTVLSNLSIHDCTFRDCRQGIGTDWYWPARYKARLTNVMISDCTSTGATNGCLALNCIEGGYARRVRSLDGGGYFEYGTCAGFAASVKDFVIEDCEFASMRREAPYDGVAFDFEGDCDNVSFRDNVIHDNDGSGLMVMNFWAGNPQNNNISIADNVFYNNALNHDGRPATEVELLCWNADSNGVLSNNGIYARSGVPHMGANWENFTQTGNRLSAYSDVSTRATHWGFDTDGDLEGWHGFDAWSTPAVSGGVLAGTSTGNASTYSPDTWINTHEFPYALIRMKQTQGTTATLAFVTEVDSTWDSAKSVTFPIVADGNMRLYALDMRDLSTRWTGVVTGLRFYATDASGSNMEIAYINAGVAPLPGIDSDEDGLTEEQETMDLDPVTPGIQNPFDPDEEDSTGDSFSDEPDGIPDGQNDWDGDGMTNAEEFAWGFNPIDPLSFATLPLPWPLAVLGLFAVGVARTVRKKRNA